MSLLDIIKERRIEKNLTQENMAELIGYSTKSAYNQLENGRIKISLEVAKKLAKILDLDISYFFKD